MKLALVFRLGETFKAGLCQRFQKSSYGCIRAQIPTANSVSFARMEICKGPQRPSGLSLLQKVLEMVKPRDIEFESDFSGLKAAPDSKGRRTRLYFI